MGRQTVLGLEQLCTSRSGGRVLGTGTYTMWRMGQLGDVWVVIEGGCRAIKYKEPVPPEECRVGRVLVGRRERSSCGRATCRLASWKPQG